MEGVWLGTDTDSQGESTSPIKPQSCAPTSQPGRTFHTWTHIHIAYRIYQLYCVFNSLYCSCEFEVWLGVLSSRTDSQKVADRRIKEKRVEGGLIMVCMMSCVFSCFMRIYLISYIFSRVKREWFVWEDGPQGNDCDGPLVVVECDGTWVTHHQFFIHHTFRPVVG